MHCCPAVQAGPVPHLHTPAVQLSAVLPLQAVQAPPPVPHAENRPTLQVAPLQQPAGHVVASHGAVVVVVGHWA